MSKKQKNQERVEQALNELREAVEANNPDVSYTGPESISTRLSVLWNAVFQKVIGNPPRGIDSLYYYVSPTGTNFEDELERNLELAAKYLGQENVSLIEQATRMTCLESARDGVQKVRDQVLGASAREVYCALRNGRIDITNPASVDEALGQGTDELLQNSLRDSAVYWQKDREDRVIHECAESIQNGTFNGLKLPPEPVDTEFLRDPLPPCTEDCAARAQAQIEPLLSKAELGIARIREQVAGLDGSAMIAGDESRGHKGNSRAAGERSEPTQGV